MNIIVEGPQGKRKIESGTPFKLNPGEKIVGSDGEGRLEEEKKKLEDLARAEGIGVGDLVAKLTKTFGIKPCASCKQRQQVLNRLRIDGWKIKYN